jgi:hypothetical protein
MEVEIHSFAHAMLSFRLNLTVEVIFMDESYGKSGSIAVPTNRLVFNVDRIREVIQQTYGKKEARVYVDYKGGELIVRVRATEPGAYWKPHESVMAMDISDVSQELYLTCNMYQEWNYTSKPPLGTLGSIKESLKKAFT